MDNNIVVYFSKEEIHEDIFGLFKSVCFEDIPTRYLEIETGSK